MSSKNQIKPNPPRTERVSIALLMVALSALVQPITSPPAVAQFNGNVSNSNHNTSGDGQANGNSIDNGDGTVIRPINTNRENSGPTAQTPIRVVYPTPAPIDAPKSFIVGCCQPGDNLTCNGESVKTTKQGFFAHVVSLKPGDNKFTLVETGSVNATRDVHAIRTSEPPTIPHGQLTIIKDSVQPKLDMAFSPGDLVHFSVRATPGAEVSMTLDHRTIRLRTLESQASSHTTVKKSITDTSNSLAKTKKATGGKSIAVNGGIGVAYGKTFQHSSHGRDDTYYGFYKIAADDNWRNIHPRVTAVLDGKSISVAGANSLRVLHQPLLAETAHDDTIVRVGPGAGRTTPLARGIRLLVDGWEGDQIRCMYSANKHFWITRPDLEWENNDDNSFNSDRRSTGVPGPAPGAVARTINVAEDEYGSYIAIPLTQRLPYQVVQCVKPNALILKLYGVTADTDWVSDPHLNAYGDEAAKALARKKLIDSVVWNQNSDGQYDVTVALKGHRQWGFKVTWEGSELRLHIRRAPHIDFSNPAKKLVGLKICLDPGHGGKEVGAVGPSGVTESAVNLGIALRLRDLLEKSGAQVIMTRTGDQDVSLEDRVRIAKDNNVAILLSVHNNSLPDGRDPWLEHGTSSYYYHPQSSELSQHLNSALASTMNLSSIGNRFQNLALARPSAMPSVLAEVGFMINPEEYALLISPEGQDLAAQGLFKGLHDYLLGPDHKSADHKP